MFAKNTIGVGTLYVDGVAANVFGDLSSIMGENVATNAPLRFGAEQQTDPAHLWQGAIDEVRIYTRRAFSAQEVANLYNPPLSVVSDTRRRSTWLTIKRSRVGETHISGAGIGNRPQESPSLRMARYQARQPNGDIHLYSSVGRCALFLQ